MTQIQHILRMETSYLPSVCQRPRCLRDVLGNTNHCPAHQPKPKAPAPPWRGKPVVYVVGMQDEPYAKIGFASELSSRMVGMQVGSPKALIVHCVFSGTLKAEAALHCVLGEYHVRGEWFHLDAVKILCAQLVHDRVSRSKLGLTGIIAAWSQEGHHWDAKGLPRSGEKKRRVDSLRNI